MFPAELLTFGVSVLGGGGMAAFSRVLTMFDTHQKNKLELEKVRSNIQIKEMTTMNKLANAAAIRGGPWVKRILAMSCVVILLSPVILPLIDKTIPTTYLYNEDTRKFLFGIFGGGLSKLRAQTYTGLVFLPIHTHTCMAIIGYYFGVGSVKK